MAKLSDRSAPLDNYMAPGKVEQRGEFYETTAAIFGSLADKRIGLLPSWNAHKKVPCPEIITALDSGARIENLFAVDDNLTIMRRVKRAFPRINIIPAKLHVACKVLADLGITLDALNADLCCASREGSEILTSVNATGCLTADAIVSVTTARRDSEKVNAEAHQNGQGLLNHLVLRNARTAELLHRTLTDLDYVRFWNLFSAMRGFRMIHSGSYKSTVAKRVCKNKVKKSDPTTMLWAMFQKSPLTN